MVYVRSKLSIRFFPRLTLVYFVAFHLYFFETLYGFTLLALFVCFMAMAHAMVYFVREAEVPSLVAGILTEERPRAMSMHIHTPSWRVALPPYWTLFYMMDTPGGLPSAANVEDLALFNINLPFEGVEQPADPFSEMQELLHEEAGEENLEAREQPEVL